MIVLTLVTQGVAIGLIALALSGQVIYRSPLNSFFAFALSGRYLTNHLKPKASKSSSEAFAIGLIALALSGRVFYRSPLKNPDKKIVSDCKSGTTKYCVQAGKSYTTEDNDYQRY